ncbi:RNA polymerase-associated protein LEO1-like isoform X2 [Phyllostomus hastatus]|uniref:RNA polymerase-associated protein LEO1-like isoform X2 n=1 Tax=Phyllostomus hastatus TaxID=9423 RepID=UPI001E685466|nr:RNA polymerase-associated protein LEO1-like isoform X2 [Phyllostomus hastatus]
MSGHHGDLGEPGQVRCLCRGDRKSLPQVSTGHTNSAQAGRCSPGPAWQHRGHGSSQSCACACASSAETKEEERLRASTHQGTIPLPEKQKQPGPRVPNQESSSDDDGEEEEVEEEEEESDEASTNQCLGGLGKERGRICSSDSDVGSEEETAHGLLRTKQLSSDEVYPCCLKGR